MTKTQLNNIGPVRMCKRVLKSQTSESAEIPFFKISTFGDKPDTYIEKTLYEDFRKKYSFPKKGDILISAAGTVGKTVVYDGRPAYFQDSNIVWIENDESQVLNKYLYYFYQTKPWQTTNGSTIKRIYNDDLKGIAISFPDIPLQQKIAFVLSALDEKIELNSKINSELEQMAKTLYDYWFVQFDFPDTDGEPYKSSGGKMVWNEQLKREIPEQWEDGTLDDLGQIVGGSTPSTNEAGNFTMNGTPWITPNDLSDNQGNKFISHGAQDVSDEGIKDASLKKYPSGTVLLSSRAPIGYMAIAQTELTTNQGFKSFVPTKNYSTSYIYYTVKRSLTSIIQYSSGSTFKEVSAGVLKTIKISLPESNVVDHFSKTMKPIFKRQELVERENQQLAQLRDWLLPMLMNGQARVR